MIPSHTVTKSDVLLFLMFKGDLTPFWEQTVKINMKFQEYAKYVEYVKYAKQYAEQYVCYMQYNMI